MKWKGTVLWIIIAIAALVLIFSRLNKRIKHKIAREEVAQKAAQQDMPAYTPPIDSFPYLYKPYDTVAADRQQLCAPALERQQGRYGSAE